LQFNLWIVNEVDKLVDFKGLFFYDVSKKAELHSYNRYIVKTIHII